MMRPANETPVRVIGDLRLHVATDRGTGSVPLFISSATALAKVERVVVMLHGRLRDADAYFHSAQRALDASSIANESTLLVVPQFLATADIEHHRLDADMLHWEWTAWMGGLDALGPYALSSFDVLDALIEHYADRKRFPALREIVIAGHSGGAQVAHRYAIVGKARIAHVRLRYVVANPSSYVYFDASRPCGQATPCIDENHWKYGLECLPRYAMHYVDENEWEARYVQSDVTYLLGELDCDPTHAALDRTCAANAQGPHRLARGRFYRGYLSARHARLQHTWHEVPNVGHNGEAMFVSTAGVRALFGEAARLIEPVAMQTGGASE